jgi:hypothetical protein
MIRPTLTTVEKEVAAIFAERSALVQKIQYDKSISDDEADKAVTEFNRDLIAEFVKRGSTSQSGTRVLRSQLPYFR